MTPGEKLALVMVLAMLPTFLFFVLPEAFRQAQTRKKEKS